jgi:uncharacterized protein (TIGR00730 family)
MPSDGAGKVVAVFGASDAAEDSPAWREAYEVGRLVAGAGFTLINGGYGGVMAASARGAREAGGRTIGVTTQAFAARGGANAWVETEHREADLFDRTRRLVETAAAFIVLGGRSGTLAELSFLWALERAGLLGSKPVVLLGQPWEGLLADLRRRSLIGESEAAITRLARSPREAVDSVSLSLRRTA